MQGGRTAAPITSHPERRLLGTYCWQGPGPRLPERSLRLSFQGHLCSGVPFTDGTCDTLPWQLAQDMPIQMTVGSEVTDIRPSVSTGHPQGLAGSADERREQGKPRGTGGQGEPGVQTHREPNVPSSKRSTESSLQCRISPSVIAGECFQGLYTGWLTGPGSRGHGQWPPC